MQAKESEGADQQAGHGPEGIEKSRIFFPVVRGRMGKISGKALIGLGMALGAGLNNIGLINHRLITFDRHDIMRAMTVRAFGRLFSPPQHGGPAMVGF